MKDLPETEERIEIGSLEKPQSTEPVNQAVAQEPVIKKSRLPNFAPKLIMGFLGIFFLSLSFLAGQQFLGPRLNPSIITDTDQEKMKVAPQSKNSSLEKGVVPEIYSTEGDGQEPCSLEFTVVGAPVCLVVKITDSEGQEITDFSQLKIDDQIRLLVNGSYSEQISKARFQVNQTANNSWCQGTNLTLADNWCETTNKEGDYYYVDYSLPQTGEFSIGAMIFDSNSLTWY